MGRIRTKYIKRITTKLIRECPNAFNKEFEANKKGLAEVATIPSKVIRNKVAGSIARTIKTRKD